MLRALQDKLLRQDLFDEFCDEFTREMNRLRMERSSLSAAEREIERIEIRRKKLIEMVMNGVAPSEVKGRAERERSQTRETEDNPRSRWHTTAAAAPGDGRAVPPRESLLWLRHSNIQRPARKPLRRFEAHRRHRPDAEPGPTPNRAERESGDDVGGRPKCDEVARNRRPLAASCDGCGGGI